MAVKWAFTLLVLSFLSVFPASNIFAMPSPFQDRLHLSEDDMVLPEKGTEFLFRRYYNGGTKFHGPLGLGWGFTFGASLVLDRERETITLKDGDGLITVFEKSGENEYRTKSNSGESIVVQSDGKIQRKIKNAGMQIFSSDGFLEKIIDPFGHVFQLIYEDKTLSLILTSSGREISFEANDMGEITAISVAGGRKVEYRYNNQNELILVRNISGKETSYAYDDQHNITEIKYPDGSRRNIVYKKDTNRIVELKGPGERSVKYEYFNQKGYRVTFESGYQVIYQDDLEKRQRIVSDNDGIKNILKYDANDRLTESRDSLGRTWTFEYDEAGRIIKMTDTDGNKAEYIYEKDSGLLIMEKSNDRITRQYEYDAAGNVILLTNEQGLATRYTYDTHGLMETLTDYKGRMTVFAHDTFGNISQMIHTGNIRTSYIYDTYGRLVEETGPTGSKISYAYDIGGNLIKKTLSNGLVFEYSYDAAGNCVKETRPDGSAQEFIFDQKQLIKKINWEGGISEFKYDAGGRLLEETKPNGSKNTYIYNVSGLLKEKKDALGHITKFSYDSAGRLIQRINPDGSETAFSYDSADRLIGKKTSSGRAVLWNYNGLQSLDEVVEGENAWISRYDEAGRLISFEDKRLGLKSGFEYDSKGNVTAIRYPNGENIVFSYDDLNRPLAVKNQDGQGLEYQYSEKGIDYKIRYSNGILEEYHFDADELLKDYLASLNGRAVFGYVLSRNESRQIREKQFLSGLTHQFEYDKMGRLSKFRQSETVWEKYNYDKNGNIVSVERPKGKTSFTYDQADRLLSDGTFSYTYDLNGNLIQKKWQDIVISLAYDENQLTGVSSTSGNSSQFSYDGYGRRNSSVVNGQKKMFSCLYENVAMELNENAQITRIYLQGLGIDHPVFFKDAGGIYFYHYDQNGNVIALTDAKGEVVNQYVYGPFGKAIQKKEKVQNPFQYTGREWEDSFGLYYYRARYYDPAIYRFISEDLIKNENLYVYADNDPVNRVDPFGLATVFTPPQARVNAVADAMGFNRPTYAPNIEGAYGVHETTLLGNDPIIKVSGSALRAGEEQVRSTIFHENVHELQRLRNPYIFAQASGSEAATAALEREAHMRTYEYAVRNGLSREVQQHSLDAVRAYGGTQAEVEAYMARVGTAMPAESSILSRTAGVLGRGAAIAGAAHMSFTAGYAAGTFIENRYHVGEEMGIRDWEYERQIKNQRVEKKEEDNLDSLESFVRSRAEVNQINLRSGVNLSNVRDLMQENLENGRKPLDGLLEKPEERAAREQREREAAYERYEAEQARINSERKQKEEEFENNVLSQVQGLIGKIQGLESNAQAIAGKVQGAVQTAKSVESQVISIVNAANGLSGKINQVSGLLQQAQSSSAAIQGLNIDKGNVIDVYAKVQNASQSACDIADNMQTANSVQNASIQASSQASLAETAAAGVKGAVAHALSVCSGAESQLAQIQGVKQQVEAIQAEAKNTKVQMGKLNGLLQSARATVDAVKNTKAEVESVQAQIESAKNAAKGLLAPYLAVAKAQALLVQISSSASKLNADNADKFIQEGAAVISRIETKIGEVSNLQEIAVPDFNMDLGALNGKVMDICATANTLDLYESKIDAEVGKARNCANKASQSVEASMAPAGANFPNPPAGWSPIGESVAGPNKPSDEAQSAARQSADQQIEDNNSSTGMNTSEPGQPQQPSSGMSQPPQGPQGPHGSEGHSHSM